MCLSLRAEAATSWSEPPEPGGPFAALNRAPLMPEAPPGPRGRRPHRLLAGAEVDHRRDQVAYVRRDRNVVVSVERVDPEQVGCRLASGDADERPEARREHPRA